MVVWRVISSAWTFNILKMYRMASVLHEVHGMTILRNDRFNATAVLRAHVKRRVDYSTCLWEGVFVQRTCAVATFISHHVAVAKYVLRGYFIVLCTRL